MAQPPIDEGWLTANRISELVECPVMGRFDTAHLREIHRRIFQDLPHHGPGQFRRDAPAWVKARELESGDQYYVPYAPRPLIESGLSQVLPAYGGPDAFRGLLLSQFTERMAEFYADLDYLHPFSEGNSRTLRTFTRQLAYEAGFDLNWDLSNIKSGRSFVWVIHDEPLKIARQVCGCQLVKGRTACTTETGTSAKSWSTGPSQSPNIPVRPAVRRGSARVGRFVTEMLRRIYRAVNVPAAGIKPLRQVYARHLAVRRLDRETIQYRMGIPNVVWAKTAEPAQSQPSALQAS